VVIGEMLLLHQSTGLVHHDTAPHQFIIGQTPQRGLPLLIPKAFAWLHSRVMCVASGDMAICELDAAGFAR
jgi:hypothetical protein